MKSVETTLELNQLVQMPGQHFEALGIGLVPSLASFSDGDLLLGPGPVAYRDDLFVRKLPLNLCVPLPYGALLGNDPQDLRLIVGRQARKAVRIDLHGSPTRLGEIIDIAPSLIGDVAQNLKGSL